MHTKITLDPTLFEKNEDGGDHCASLKLYASYIAAKSIKMTKYNNKYKQLVKTAKRIFKLEDLTVRNYLQIGLISWRRIATYSQPNIYVWQT